MVDSYGQHEVLHTAHIVAALFEERLLRHDWVQENPVLKNAAIKLSGELGAFYQLVGNENYKQDYPK